MSRVQMKRRKKREKGSASVRSLICAFSGMVGIIFFIYAVCEAAVKSQMPRSFTGLAMIFFFAGLIEMVLGVRFAKIPGHSLSSKVCGILFPAISLAGYLTLYLIGVYRLL